MTQPDLNYVSQTTAAVSVNYNNLPANTEIVWVNEFGQVQTVGSVSVPAGGQGALQVPIDPTLASNRYYLLARTSDVPPAYLAQTVNFYITNPNDVGGPEL